ncbi:MAG: MBL fold metallo-hydrolase [Oscillospiraceae bacterium]|nr:MBL fold metallo-hydrolase [Oscillospiraceae bacterium]
MRRFLALLLALLLLLPGCAGTPAETESTAASTTGATVYTFTKTLKVHFIDVGQADCALLECDNAFALIDGGNVDNGPAVVEYLELQGVQRLNLVVGTHPHGDHIGGLAAVLDAYPADNVWSSELTYYNSTVYSFINGAKKQGKQLHFPQVGDTFQLGGAVITMIGPVKRGYEDTNNLSLVLMVEYGDTRFLFTGDMERDAELDVLDSGADVKADVLKVGHHGSYSSTSYVFLRAVHPTYAVISVGRDNEYGHPHDAPMSRLMDADVIIFRTDQMNNIVAVSDGQDITFTWGNTDAAPWYPKAA